MTKATTETLESARSELTTGLLAQFGEGGASAKAQLIPLIYKELHRLAAGHMRRERPNHTLQATALVNEAWLRLIQQPQMNVQSRASFFGIASNLMRQILVDHARKRKTAKRGMARQQITLTDNLLAATPGKLMDVLVLDQALQRLAAIDQRAAKIIEMHFFGGLSFEEMAVVLGVSARTVKRDWRMARAWLHSDLAVAT
jgi:RNA polymerase sigma-70 factor (ECF subfamily)